MSRPHFLDYLLHVWFVSQRWRRTFLRRLISMFNEIVLGHPFRFWQCISIVKRTTGSPIVQRLNWVAARTRDQGFFLCLFCYNCKRFALRNSWHSTTSKEFSRGQSVVFDRITRMIPLRCQDEVSRRHQKHLNRSLLKGRLNRRSLLHRFEVWGAVCKIHMNCGLSIFHFIHQV